MRTFEMFPAYGRDYRSSNDVKDAFLHGSDFKEMSIKFEVLNLAELPKPCLVHLHFNHNSEVAEVTIN